MSENHQPAFRQELKRIENEYEDLRIDIEGVLHCSDSTVSRIMTGQRKTSYIEVMKIIRLLVRKKYITTIQGAMKLLILAGYGLIEKDWENVPDLEVLYRNKIYDLKEVYEEVRIGLEENAEFQPNIPVSPPDEVVAEPDSPASPPAEVVMEKKTRFAWPVLLLGFGGLAAIVLVISFVLWTIFSGTKDTNTAVAASPSSKIPAPATVIFDTPQPTIDIPNTASSQSKQAIDCYNNAKAALEKKDFAAVVTPGNCAIQADPNFVAAYVILGQAYYELGQYENVLKAMDKALALNPKISTIYRIRAYVYDRMKNFEAGLKEWNKFLQLQPNDPAGYYWRGLDYNNLGKKEIACNDLKKADSLGNVNAKKALAQLNCLSQGS